MVYVRATEASIRPCPLRWSIWGLISPKIRPLIYPTRTSYAWHGHKQRDSVTPEISDIQMRKIQKKIACNFHFCSLWLSISFASWSSAIPFTFYIKYIFWDVMPSRRSKFLQNRTGKTHFSGSAGPKRGPNFSNPDRLKAKIRGRFLQNMDKVLY